MTIKNPSSLTFTELRERFVNREQNMLHIGHETYAERWKMDDDHDEHDGEHFIAVLYRDTKIVNLFADGSVQLFDGGLTGATVAKRMCWFTKPLGLLVFTSKNYKGRRRWHDSVEFKLYRIGTGEYLSYHAGITIGVTGWVQ